MKTVMVTAIGSFSADGVIRNLHLGGYRVVGCDIYPKEWVANAYEVDAFYKVPCASETESYAEMVLSLCRTERAEELVVLTDAEVDVWNERRAQALEAGVTLCLPREQTIRICRDKMRLYEFLKERGIGGLIPTGWLSKTDPETCAYPVVCKPYNGRSSQGLRYVATGEELREMLRAASTQRDAVVVQPFLKGNVVTADIVRQADTKACVVVCRRELLRTLNGAGTSVRVFCDPVLEEMCRRIADELGINGCVNLEWIEDEEGQYHLLECNPRFSGGVKFSCMAGYDCVINHMRCFEGEAIDISPVIQPMYIARKYEEFVTMAETEADLRTREDGPIMASVCCVTYNQAEYIRSALDSFLMQQTNFAFEVVIHDDASTDGTAEILREYERRFPGKVRPLIQEKNQYSQGIDNINGAFNFPRARGKYIFMCDGDDYWLSPYKMQKQVDYMEAHPDCTLCIHSARLELVGKALAGGQMRPYKKDRIIQPGEIIDKPSGYAMASMAFPARLTKKLPDYYVDCPVGDTPLQLMAAAEGYGYYMDEPMCAYRVGVSGSWTMEGKTGDYAKKQRQYYKRMKKTYMEFDAATGGRFHKEAVSASRRTYYLTMVNTRRFDEIRKPEYRRYYKELDAKTRFFIRFEYQMPEVYQWLRKQYTRS